MLTRKPEEWTAADETGHGWTNLEVLKRNVTWRHPTTDQTAEVDRADSKMHFNTTRRPIVYRQFPWLKDSKL